jgi:hypothetical protein
MRLHIVLTPLVGLFILARIFIRLRVDGLGFDDWAMIFAGVFYMASVGIALPITIMGYGQHTWYLSPDTIILSLKVRRTSSPYIYLCTRKNNNQVIDIAVFLRFGGPLLSHFNLYETLTPPVLSTSLPQ